WAFSWKTVPTRLRNAAFGASPNARSVPAGGVSIAASRVMKVLLPLPFGPSRPNTLPRGTVRSKPSRAVLPLYPNEIAHASTARPYPRLMVTSSHGAASGAMRRRSCGHGEVRHQLTHHDEHEDCQQRAEVHHPGAGHHPPDRFDDRLGDPEQELVERAGLV